MTPSEARALHTETDARIKILTTKGRGPDGKKLRITCKEGCPSCCYEPVFAERAEATVALQAAEALGPRVFLGIMARINEAAKKLLDAFIHEPKASVPVVMYRSLRVPCPMLDMIDGRCMIYESRPFGCRAHLAVGPVRRCEVNALRHTQLYAQSPQLSLVRFLSKTGPGLHEVDHFIFHLARKQGMKIESASAKSLEVKA